MSDEDGEKLEAAVRAYIKARRGPGMGPSHLVDSRHLEAAITGTQDAVDRKIAALQDQVDAMRANLNRTLGRAHRQLLIVELVVAVLWVCLLVHLVRG